MKFLRRQKGPTAKIGWGLRKWHFNQLVFNLIFNPGFERGSRLEGIETIQQGLQDFYFSLFERGSRFEGIETWDVCCLRVLFIQFERASRLEGIETIMAIAIIPLPLSSLKEVPDLKGLKLVVSVINRFFDFGLKEVPDLKGLKHDSLRYAVLQHRRI